MEKLAITWTNYDVIFNKSLYFCQNIKQQIWNILSNVFVPSRENVETYFS